MVGLLRKLNQCADKTDMVDKEGNTRYNSVEDARGSILWVGNFAGIQKQHTKQGASNSVHCADVMPHSSLVPISYSCRLH